MYKLLKKALFKMDAEDAHNIVMSLAHRFPQVAQLVGRSNQSTNKYNLTVGRNTWSFPVGLAAGLDKNGMCIPFFSQLGFGAIEVGTVTPYAQVGNAKPRLHRLVTDNSLRNSMGFNNDGAKALINSLKRVNNQLGVIGVNIGKNKQTSDINAAKDYSYLYDNFKDYCDYIVINVSSPNTPGLRGHQTREELSKILSALNYRNECDLFVKISPDIDIASLEDIIKTIMDFNLTGIIATNTTINENYGIGGISGDLLFDKSESIRNRCLEILDNDKNLELIGVGGFSNFEQLKNYWRLGGGAVQIYSSFVYQGPSILSSIQKNLDDELVKYSLSSFEEYKKFLRSNQK